MQAVALADVTEFLERAGPLLLADEARHNLILGIAGVLRARPEVYPDFHLWVVEDGAAPVAAALITSPHNLVLADATQVEALPRLAAAVLESGPVVPGVLGNRPTVDRFNEVYAPRAGVRAHLRMAQGVFSLERVQPIAAAAGRARRAGPGDRAQILAWLEAFSAEALPGEPFVRERTERGVDRVLGGETAEAGIWLWQDGAAAGALAAYGSPTPGGSRVGPVYTPPECRRRGYATCLVAALSAWILEQGWRRCFLYTDLANPTSNAIYRRIGYRQVAESAEYVYAAAD